MKQPLCLLLQGSNANSLLTFVLETFLLKAHFTSTNFIFFLKYIDFVTNNVSPPLLTWQCSA